MDLITDKLYLGDYSDVTKQKIRSCHIQAVLNVAIELDDIPTGIKKLKNPQDWIVKTSTLPTGVDYFKIPLDDGFPIPREHIDKAVTWVKGRWSEDKTVLVHCCAGESRSVAIVLCCLIAKGHDLDEAFNMIRKKRAGSNPHPALLKSVVDYYLNVKKENKEHASRIGEEVVERNRKQFDALL